MGHTQDMHSHERGMSYLRDLRHALNHLYEPEALREHPLVQVFGLGQEDDVVSALRRLLLEAIEKMRPEEDVPLQSAVWRTYHVMVQRFAEQATQQEVANDLGLSVRQIRRQESGGLKELFRLLSKKHKLAFDDMPPETAEPSSLVKVLAASLPATSREQELAWSQQSFPREFLPISVLVRSVVETVSPLAKMMDVHVTYTASQDMPRLVVQPTTARQALLALLALAIRRVPSGRISVTSLATSTGIVVEIAAHMEQGGMVPLLEDKESLDFIQTLIASSGGELELLPAVTPIRPVLARITLASEQQMTVMVIDDNPDALRLMERYATDTCYRVVSVQEPQEALSMAEELMPDIIVMDVMMPNIDGWELMGRLRQHPKIGGIPLVVCTILPQEQFALALGATTFLRKPISRKDFLVVLDNQLDLLRR